MQRGMKTRARASICARRRVSNRCKSHALPACAPRHRLAQRSQRQQLGRRGHEPLHSGDEDSEQELLAHHVSDVGTVQSFLRTRLIRCENRVLDARKVCSRADPTPVI